MLPLGIRWESVLKEALVKVVDSRLFKGSSEQGRIQSTPTTREGAGGYHGLVVLIPCRRHLLQDAAPYGESNKSCRHTNYNAVITKMMGLQFSKNWQTVRPLFEVKR